MSVLVIKFPWCDDAAGALASARADALGQSRDGPPPSIFPAFFDTGVFRSVEGGEGYAYITTPPVASAQERDRFTGRVHDILTPLLPGVRLSRLEVVQAFSGTCPGSPAPFRYVVETDVLERSDADLNAWYFEEHLPGLAAVPGTVRISRMIDREGSPRYHSFYDLVAQDVLGSPDWLVVRGTEWSSRVRPEFRNTKRTMFRRIA